VKFFLEVFDSEYLSLSTAVDFSDYFPPSSKCITLLGHDFPLADEVTKFEPSIQLKSAK
jgi:hypothetical protein